MWVFQNTLKKMEIKNIFQIQSIKHSIENWDVKKNKEHIIHNHGNSGLGGVIYLNYDNTIHEPTRYLMPLNDLINENSLIYNEPVAEGDILIMPSFIHHYSSFNKSKKIRSIIGFDLEFVK